MSSKSTKAGVTVKAQQAEELQRFADIPGHELLLPFSQVKGSDQARLIARLQDLGLVDLDQDEATIGDLDLDALADFIDYVGEHFALDLEQFEQFTMGPGGMERAINLAIAYAGDLGKGEI